MNYKLLIGCFFATLCLHSDVTSQAPLTLEEAVSKSLANNFQIVLAQMQVEIAENNNSWGQTSALPTIGLSGAYNNNVSDQSQNPTAFIREKLISTGVQYGAALNWTLFDGFGMFATKRQLELLEEQSEGNASLVVENTVQGVVLAYYNALVQKEKLQVLEEVITLSRDRLAYMKVKQEMGAATTFEILQFDNAIIADSSNYLLQQLALNNAMRNLNLFMAEDLETEWDLTTSMVAPELNYDLASIWSEVKNNNQAMRNQMVNSLLAEQDLRLAKAGMFPVIGFAAGINDSQNTFRAGELQGDGKTLNYFGNFTLNFNLFNGGKTRRAIQNAHIREEMATISIDDLSKRTESELRNTFNLYEAQRDIYDMTAKNVQNQKTSLDIAADRFNNGVISSFDYRSVQVAYLNAAMQRIESMNNLLSTHTNLVRLRGGLIKAN
ncbi:MAG: TolC family protein [Flavobacteriaceae bacterium]|nr:TolC family protein [Flavobacteriaceae bacterium]